MVAQRLARADGSSVGGGNIGQGNKGKLKDDKKEMLWKSLPEGRSAVV